MEQITEHDIRYTDFYDLGHLTQWLSNPEILQWYPMSIGKEVEEAAKNWIGFSKYKCSLTATVKNEVCGIATLYLMPYRKVSHHCMFYMIVDSKWQRQGIGTSLLRNLMNLAGNYFSLESIHTEVFEGSPIIPLLEKLKFESFAKLEHFAKVDGKYLSRILYEHVF